MTTKQGLTVAGLAALNVACCMELAAPEAGIFYKVLASIWLGCFITFASLITIGGITSGAFDDIHDLAEETRRRKNG